MSDADLAAELRSAERLRRSGKFDKAAQTYQVIIAETPSNADVRRKLADLQLEMGNRDGAISQYVKVQEQLAAEGDVLGAITAGLKVVEIDPQFDNPLAYVAKVKVENLRDEQKVKTSQTVPEIAGRTITPLDDIPLLSDLTPEELSDVAATMQRHELAEKQVLFQEGDAGDSLFFVNEGLLEAKAKGAKLGVIASGQCFGEFSFLTLKPRTATVTALERTELLELSADKMRGVVQNQPRLAEVLFSMFRDRALVNVLSRSPLFEMLPSKDRARLAPRFKLVTLSKGEDAFQEGEPGGALFVVKEGSLTVKATIQGELVELATLGQHQFYGEVSFLTGVPRTATVHALEATELLKIEEDELKELLRHHPYMKDVLSRYHLDRVTATAETLKTFLKNEKVEGIVS
jgi:CRP-like cAMP-binding protein